MSFLFKISGSLHMESSYKVLCLCKIRFCFLKGEQSFEGGGGGGESALPRSERVVKLVSMLF